MRSTTTHYARVIEIPTPRWSAYDAVRLGQPIPAGLPASIQGRAWTSLIGYAPAGDATEGLAAASLPAPEA